MAIHDLAVYEFTLAGELIPSDRISWTGSEDLTEGLARAGWELAWSMEGRDEPPRKPITANVFEQSEAACVLIELVVMGVATWILCRSRMVYLRFVRDWLAKLMMDLKPAPAQSDLVEEAVEELREEMENVLDEAAFCFGPAPCPRGGRRSRR